MLQLLTIKLRIRIEKRIVRDQITQLYTHTCVVRLIPFPVKDFHRDAICPEMDTL